MGFKLSTQAYCIIGNQLWFAVRNFNGLFKMNLENNKISFCTSFEKEMHAKQNLFIGIEKNNNELCFLPASASNIYFYNIETGKMIECHLPKKYRDYQFKFDEYHREDERIWLISIERKDMLMLDMVSRKLEECQWIYENEKYEGSCKEGNIIYAVKKGTNIVYQFDLLAAKSMTIAVNTKTVNKYAFIRYNKNLFYLFDSSSWGCVICDKEFNVIDELYFEDEIENIKSEKISRCKFINDILWLIGQKSIILKYHIIDGTLEKIYLYNNDLIEDAEELGIMGLGEIEQVNNQFYIFPGDFGNIIALTEDNVFSEIPFCIDEKWVANYLMENSDEYAVLREKNECSLEIMLHIFEMNKDVKMSAKREKKTGYGRAIYKYIVEES